MSNWRDINQESDIEVNPNDDTLEVCFEEDYWGLSYLTIPMEYIRNLAEFSSLKGEIAELKSEIITLKSRKGEN